MLPSALTTLQVPPSVVEDVSTPVAGKEDSDQNASFELSEQQNSLLEENLEVATNSKVESAKVETHDLVTENNNPVVAVVSATEKSHSDVVGDDLVQAEVASFPVVDTDLAPVKADLPLDPGGGVERGEAVAGAVKLVDQTKSYPTEFYRYTYSRRKNKGVVPADLASTKADMSSVPGGVVEGGEAGVVKPFDPIQPYRYTYTRRKKKADVASVKADVASSGGDGGLSDEKALPFDTIEPYRYTYTRRRNKADVASGKADVASGGEDGGLSDGLGDKKAVVEGAQISIPAVQVGLPSVLEKGEREASIAGESRAEKPVVEGQVSDGQVSGVDHFEQFAPAASSGPECVEKPKLPYIVKDPPAQPPKPAAGQEPAF